MPGVHEGAKAAGHEHPRLIELTRALLQQVGKPWVIENVPGAPLVNPAMLCGLMFDLHVHRHRLFETSFELLAIAHPPHLKQQVKMGRPVVDGDIMHVVGHFSNVAYARRAMGDVDWMTRDGLAEAIPPAYTRWIGEQLLAQVMGSECVSECCLPG